MPLNCQVGDLAVVINDEPGCENNIGRFVTVLRASSVRDSSAAWWSVEPVDGQPWTCIRPIQGGKWVEVHQEIGSVLIEDHCLRPVRGASTSEQTTQKESSHPNQPMQTTR